MTQPISKAGAIDQTPSRPDDGGYTYVSLLILLVTIALAAQTTWMPRETQVRRELERELLFRGRAYREAIRSYWLTGGDAPSLPATLDDLVSDARVAGLRHIRRLYDNPVGEGWDLILGPEGGIAGVAPRAGGAPLLRWRDGSGSEMGIGSESYSDWKFVFQPEGELP